MERYGVSREPASKALRELEKEELVTIARKSGSRVRRPPQRRQITRERTAYRDEIGYFFDKAALGWRPLAPVEIRRGPVPWDVAAALSVPGASWVHR